MRAAGKINLSRVRLHRTSVAAPCKAKRLSLPRRTKRSPRELVFAHAHNFDLATEESESAHFAHAPEIEPLPTYHIAIRAADTCFHHAAFGEDSKLNLNELTFGEVCGCINQLIRPVNRNWWVISDNALREQCVRSG